MHDNAGNALALRELYQGGEVFHVGVHPAGGDEAHEVERPALAHRGAGLAQCGFVEEAAVIDRVVDADELLILDVAGTHREMPDLAVPHDSVRQTDSATAGLELRVRAASEERIKTRRLRTRHRVARSIGSDPPPVEHAKHHRTVGRCHANARTIAANSSALSEAPPTSAPSMPSARANSPAPAAVTLPP